jgi:hypothetical protein
LISFRFAKAYTGPLEQFLIGHQILNLTNCRNLRDFTSLFLRLRLFKHSLNLFNVISHTPGHFLVVMEVLNLKEVFHMVLLSVSEKERNFFYLLDSTVRVVLNDQFKHTSNVLKKGGTGLVFLGLLFV